MTPRDAASLILHRSTNTANGAKLEILLGRRPTKSSFMPDVYVFPGGGVELADSRARPATDLRKEYAANMAVSNSFARARTIALAAVRETFEETGLIIGHESPHQTSKHSSWNFLVQKNAAADLAILRYIGRAITPTTRSIRFHARFFSCDTQLIQGFESQQLIGNGELLDLQWVDIGATEKLPLRPVTQYMMMQLQKLNQKNNLNKAGNAVYMHRHGKLKITGGL